MIEATNANNDAAAWHAISDGDVVKRLITDSEKGLDSAEASARLQKYGPNRLPEGKKRGPFMRFLAQFNNILVYVLLGAGFTKLMLNLWVDASIIFGVVVLNSLLGFMQEGKAEKALDSIRNMLSAEARTVRGGETRVIAAEQLVPGDIMVRRRQGGSARQGRSGSHSRALRSPAVRERPGGVARSRTFHASRGPARCPRRARAGAGLA